MVSLPAESEPSDVFAIGDIHGRADLLRAFRRLIAETVDYRNTESCVTVLIGDYIDRGPHSREVLEILSNEEFPTRMIPLAGNHEQMFLKALRSADDFRTWALNGGGATLRSYGLDAPAFLNDQVVAKLQSELRASMPPRHRSFIEALPTCVSIGSYFFCHAGVRPEVPIQKQTVADLLWIRDEFLRFEGSFERRVVHGHTPVQQIEFRSNRINIDTGAAWTGRLSGVRLQGGQEIPLEVRSA